MRRSDVATRCEGVFIDTLGRTERALAPTDGNWLYRGVPPAEELQPYRIDARGWPADTEALRAIGQAETQSA